jgi:hypothetical protein
MKTYLTIYEKIGDCPLEVINDALTCLGYDLDDVILVNSFNEDGDIDTALCVLFEDNVSMLQVQMAAAYFDWYFKNVN